MFVNGDTVIYFVILGVQYFPKETKILICNKNNTTNIYRIQTFHSIMCGNFCIGFTDFMIKGKTMLNNTKLFSPNEYEKIDKTKLKFF